MDLEQKQQDPITAQRRSSHSFLLKSSSRSDRCAIDIFGMSVADKHI